MNVALVISTVDRSPKANYLARTIQSLVASGLERSLTPFTFAVVDAGSPDPAEFLGNSGVLDLPDVTLEVAERRQSHLVNAIRCVQVAAETDAEWAILCEDDIEVCADFLDNAAEWLSVYGNPRYPLFALGCPYPQVSQEYRKGNRFWSYPVDAFYGTQCVAFSRDAIEHLDEWLEENPRPRQQEAPHFDLHLHTWARVYRPGSSYLLAAAPSFVNHIGRESTLGSQSFECPSFQGPNWPRNQVRA